MHKYQELSGIKYCNENSIMQYTLVEFEMLIMRRVNLSQVVTLRRVTKLHSINR